jgi:hypothetical protein
MSTTLFSPGDRVIVTHFPGCEAGARGTVTEHRVQGSVSHLIERLHPADGSLIRMYWVRFDEPLPQHNGEEFELATVPPDRMRLLNDG